MSTPNGSSGGWGPAEGRPPGYGPRPEQGQPQDGGQQQGQPPDGQPQYGRPQYEQPQYGQPQYGQPQYGAPPSGRPQQGQPQHGQPQYGQPQYGTPQYGGPGYGGPGYGDPAGRPSGYRPPAVQPGVVPLRPLSLGEIFDGAFRSVRANPRVMFGFTAIVVTVAVAVGTLFQWLLLPTVSGAFSELSSEIDPTGAAGVADSFGLAVSSIAMLPWTTVATAVLTGLLTVSVSRSVIGRRTTVGELWSTSWRHVLLLVAYTIVLGLVSLAVVGAWVAGLFALAGADSWGPFVALALGGGLALVVVGTWVLVRLLFVPPAMVLERTGLRSIPRAWKLSRGSFWRILGIYLLTSIIVYVVSQLVVTPFTLVATFAVQGDLSSGVGLVLINLGTALASILTIVFTAAVVALLYIDVRIRREGLDVELARAAETGAA